MLLCVISHMLAGNAAIATGVPRGAAWRETGFIPEKYGAGL
jgi:hypothetical protein